MKHDKEQVLKIIREYFKDQNDISTVYLFGSVAKGRTTSHSDVDIAVLFVPGLSLFQRFERRLELANDLADRLKKKVDLVDLAEADLFFIHQVMLHKEIVLDKDIERRVSFEVEKRRNYFDRKYFYDLYHRQALKRLGEKGRK
ncbi:MAG TPA: nucleotidyltransferase domain-containing protein [Clostridia bacterium]|nr:nucleotidyltransferase domain-containing protein [Clostridia bacterium]HHY05881.1 nucleotidyltransferase domain-containing protein [Clostridia bacterium]